MKDNVRKELKELCYFIIENNNALARPEQLTRVQMLYERLLVLNYLEEVEAEKRAELKAKSAPVPAAPPKEQSSPAAPTPPPPPPPVQEEIAAEPAPSPQQAPSEIVAEAPEEVPYESPNEEASLVERRDLNDEHDAPKSVNDQLAKGAIQVGLNDRIAFVKYLFNDSQADFNRVLSQLNTLDTYLESMYFIENLVKPDYNWDDKKDYEERLINLIKKRFGEDW